MFQFYCEHVEHDPAVQNPKEALKRLKTKPVRRRVGGSGGVRPP
jgi:hypothetical protein